MLMRFLGHIWLLVRLTRPGAIRVGMGKEKKGKAAVYENAPKMEEAKRGSSARNFTQLIMHKHHFNHISLITQVLAHH